MILGFFFTTNKHAVFYIIIIFLKNLTKIVAFSLARIVFLFLLSKYNYKIIIH